MKKSELRKQIEELQEEQKSLLLDLRDIVMEKDFFKANGVKFRWRTKFELEDIFYDGKPMQVALNPLIEYPRTEPFTKEFIAGLKKAEPLPHIEDLRNAGFIHDVQFGEAGSVGFDHLSGNIVWGSSAFGLEHNVGDEQAKKYQEARKKEVQKKYPEGILSFKDGNAIFKRVFLNSVTYNQWVEAYMRLNIPIYSVKNSKGEIFTVGDTVTNIVAGGRVCKIESFFVSNDGIRASYEGLPSTNIHIDGIVKAEKPKPVTKYPEGILSFKKADGTFGYYIEKLTIIPYQEWCEYHLESKPVASIQSVKNSKGEVLHKGDFIYLLSPQTGQQGLIESFEVCGDEGERFIAVDLKKEGGTQRIKIDSITKIYPDGIPKIEKQQPSWKDQIVAFRGKCTGYIFHRDKNFKGTYHSSMTVDELLPHEEIFTVKNSAGVEFSVGDDTNYGKIKSFLPCQVSETKGHFQVISDGGAISFNYPLEEYTKAEPKKEPKAFFKTEDGFDIFHNDRYYAVYRDTILPHIALGGITYGIPFKEKANAEKYIAEHAKSISWSEIDEFILRATWNQNINTGRDFLMIYYEDFINRFKPKS